MILKDTKIVGASRDVVWRALLDCDVLKACVPGCSEMTGNLQDGFEAVVTQKVGPVKATFKGTVALTDMVEGQSLTISGSGKGGAAGFAKGSAQVTLTDTEEGASLAYEVDAKVGGKLAQLGSRIIDGFAKKMATQFFENFREVVEGPAPENSDALPEETAPDEQTTSNEEKPKKGWVKRLFA